jgi:peptide-methionine (S)-S-oxide reductase
MIKKAGFGGGCHWCTEAVFAALKGVVSVGQGWISPAGENDAFSEGVVVEFDSDKIGFDVLIAIHLYTHSATSQHSMRGKYRSAVYTFSNEDSAAAQAAISALQHYFDKPLITKVLPFGDFKINRDESLNYYFSDPERPFCETYINPKLQLILQQFSGVADESKLQHLQNNLNQ